MGSLAHAIPILIKNFRFDTSYSHSREAGQAFSIHLQRLVQKLREMGHNGRITDHEGGARGARGFVGGRLGDRGKRDYGEVRGRDVGFQARDGSADFFVARFQIGQHQEGFFHFGLIEQGGRAAQ